MKTVLRMNQHAQLHKNQYTSTTKWWILGAVVSLSLIAAFVGLVVFLGMTPAEDVSLPRETQTRFRVQSPERARETTRSEDVKREREQIVDEGPGDETGEEYEGEEKEGHEAQVEEVVKDGDDEGEDIHPESLVGYDAAIIVHNLNSFQHSGVPLFPQPIPTTPSQPKVDGHTTTQDNTGQRQSSTQSEIKHPAKSVDDMLPASPTHKGAVDLANRMLDVGDDTGNVVAENGKRKREEQKEKHNIVNQFKPMPLIPSPADNLHGGEIVDINSHAMRRLDENIDIASHVPGISHPGGIESHGSYHPNSEEAFSYYMGELERYDGEESETADHPVGSFVLGRIQDLHDWLATDSAFTADNTTTNNGSIASDMKEVLRAVNSSILEGDSNILLWKLKELYNNGENDAVLNITDPAILANSSSLVSVGLLAFDLLLLHSVQQIAWEDQAGAKESMMRDPDVMAMNALFMTPEQMTALQEAGSRISKDDPVASKKSILEEIMSFVNSTMRAVMTLGQAYRSSISRRSEDTTDIAGNNSTTSLDCMWTLYCRNLDKTAKLHGLYGFLAKMNSLGLRLVMGEFPLERALDLLIREVVQGASRMNCEKMFPKCSPLIAAEVVMNTVAGTHGRS